MFIEVKSQILCWYVVLQKNPNPPTYKQLQPNQQKKLVQVYFPPTVGYFYSTETPPGYLSGTSYLVESLELLESMKRNKHLQKPDLILK